MTSIYQRVLGPNFYKLHSNIQRRFGFSSRDGMAALGSGHMERIWHGRFYTVPFLYIGAWRRIMFPLTGANIPFTIENYAYQDQWGRETVTWVRKFHFPQRVYRFDATMIYSEQRQRIVDYLGSHQHLAVDIDIWPDEKGGLRLRSGAQRFYEGPIAFSFPMLFSGIANVREWYDEAKKQYRIEVNVSNSVWGPLFGYSGSFDVVYQPMVGMNIPLDVKPIREEKRE